MTDDARGSGSLQLVRSKARKEKVLHTRVPEVLAVELKRLAESMRVPVSNVVRACLEDAVAAVSSMSHRAEGELQGLADRLGERPSRRSRSGRTPAPRAVTDDAPEAPLAGVLGFQPLVLAQDTICSLSGRALRAGDRAYLGVRSGSGPPLIVAPECLPRRFEAPGE